MLLTWLKSRHQYTTIMQKTFFQKHKEHFNNLLAQELKFHLSDINKN